MRAIMPKDACYRFKCKDCAAVIKISPRNLPEVVVCPHCGEEGKSDEMIADFEKKYDKSTNS